MLVLVNTDQTIKKIQVMFRYGFLKLQLVFTVAHKKW